MAEFNPYEAPAAEIAKEEHHLKEPGGAWRDGKLLVMRPEANLPDRCIRCNAPAGGFRFKRNLSWHPPGWYLLLFFNLIIYVIVALIVRKRAKVAVGLCARHRKKRANAIILGWLDLKQA